MTMQLWPTGHWMVVRQMAPDELQLPSAKLWSPAGNSIPRYSMPNAGLQRQRTAATSSSIDAAESVRRTEALQNVPHLEKSRGGAPFSGESAVTPVRTAAILLGLGDGTFGLQRRFGVGNRPFSVAVGDFNADRIHCRQPLPASLRGGRDVGLRANRGHTRACRPSRCD